MNFVAIAGSTEEILVEGRLGETKVTARVSAGDGARPVITSLTLSPATATALRNLRLTDIVQAAMSTDQPALAIAGLDDATRLVHRYLQLCSSTRTPRKILAQEFGLTIAQVRHRLWRARERGILTSLGQGKAGGVIRADLSARAL